LQLPLPIFSHSRKEETDASQFKEPHDVAVDSSVNVYVVDSGNVHEKKDICAM